MSLKDPKNQKLLNDFVLEYAPLINKHINILKSKGKIPSHVEHDDLHAAGFHGLMDALAKYSHDVAGRTINKENENVFSKYADRRIQGKMLDHIAAQDPIPKVARIQSKNLEALKAPSETETTPPAKPKLSE